MNTTHYETNNKFQYLLNKKAKNRVIYKLRKEENPLKILFFKKNIPPSKLIMKKTHLNFFSKSIQKQK